MSNAGRRIVVATAALAASLFSLQLSAELVEVHLLDRLDGDLNDYCIDVNGPPQRLELDVPIQTHTCYSYRASPVPPTIDQAMDTADIAAGKIRLAKIGLCGQISGDVPGSTISLTECEDIEEQRFELKDNGEFVSALNPDLCLTAGPVSWLGGRPGGPPSRHQVRTLDLQPCGAEAAAYQRWATRAADWTTLFDGSNLDSFNTLGEAQWDIVSNYVEADGYTGSYLVTKETYDDFELELEFWPSIDANSGVYIRNESGDSIGADFGYEINIYDTNENPDNRTGAIIRFAPPMARIIAGGKWNKYQIRAEGSRIVVYLNGTLVADLDDDTYASGPIAFQNNGGLIRFRNIRIRPL